MSPLTKAFRKGTASAVPLMVDHRAALAAEGRFDSHGNNCAGQLAFLMLQTHEMLMPPNTQCL